MTLVGVTNFAPSTHGLRFTNTWPPEDRIAVNLPGFGRVAVGRANRGLCGGMVFTALDVFMAGQPPLEGGRPLPGTPLFEHIVRRLFDSFDVPGGVARYYLWMLAPDRDGGGRHRGVRSLARRTVLEEWPRIKADLDSGFPCPLGVVTVRTINPGRLGRNHQVLACGYHLSGRRVTIKVYDPNTAPAAADDAWVAFNLGDVVGFAHNLGIRDQVRGLFRVRYRRAEPPTPHLPGGGGEAITGSLGLRAGLGGG